MYEFMALYGVVSFTTGILVGFVIAFIVIKKVMGGR